MNCPKCGYRINEAKALGKKGGKSKSDAKLEASRRNGRKGGRPKKILPSEDRRKNGGLTNPELSGK